MAFYTTQYLSDQLGRELQDPDLTNWKEAERIDYINRSIRFVQNELISMNRTLIVTEYYPFFKIPYLEINGEYEWTLPADFEIPVQFKLWSELVNEIHIVPEEKLYFLEDEWEHRCCILGSKMTHALPAAAQTTVFKRFGAYTGATTQVYDVTIDVGGTTFTWNGVGSGAAVAITGDWQTLELGIEVKIEGAVAGESWTWTAYHDRVVQLVKFNFGSTENIKGTYAERQAPVATIDTDNFIPFERYYDIIYYMTLLLCRNRNEESVQMDMAVYQPVISMIRAYGHIMNNDKEFKIKTSERSGKYI